MQKKTHLKRYLKMIPQAWYFICCIEKVLYTITSYCTHLSQLQLVRIDAKLQSKLLAGLSSLVGLLFGIGCKKRLHGQVVCNTRAFSEYNLNEYCIVFYLESSNATLSLEI